MEPSRENPLAVEPALSPVGPPPANFTEVQRQVWEELSNEVADVYTHRDRAAFKLLVRQMALVESPEFAKWPASAQARLVQIVSGLLQQFGCTPSSRGRVETVRQMEAANDLAAQFLFGDAHGGER